MKGGWRARLAAMAAAAAALAVPCQAQDGEPEVAEVQAVGPAAAPDMRWGARLETIQERAARMVESLNRRGIFPEAGSIVSGSGLAGGASLRYPSFGRSRIGTELSAMWSVRGYREYSARLGLVGEARDALELKRADANVTSLFDAHASRSPSSFALFLEGVQRHSPQLDFYGLGGGLETPKTDFAASAMSLDLVTQWQPTAEAGFVGRAGVIDFSLGRGTNDEVPDLHLHYDARRAPGLARQAPWLAIGLGGAFDTRDAGDLPRHGVFAGVSVWHLESLQGTPQAITRATVDVRIFEPIVSAGGIAAFRLLSAGDHSPTGDETPFYLQYWLGGSHSLRGYSSYRLRGEALLHATAEYRWRVAPVLDLVPFVDAGMVARDVDGLLRSTMHVTPGVGLWARQGRRFLARVDWAYGREGHRAIFSLSPSF